MSTRTRQYIGARYIPKFADPVQWSSENAYDYLTMVQNQGETFMSKQYVPTGISLPDVAEGEEDNEYWVHMSNWNAQIEVYREEVLQYNNRISTVEDDLPIADFDSTNTVKKAIDDLGDVLPSTDFDSTNTVKKYIDDSLDVLPANDFDSTNTVKKYIDDSFDVLPANDFDSTNTVKKYIDDSFDVLPASSFDSTNTVAAAIAGKFSASNFINPDNYTNETTDSEKLQAAFDAAKEARGGTIAIFRNYTLTDDVAIGLHTDGVNGRIYVIGIGASAGFTMNGYHFVNNNVSTGGGVVFQNLYIEGDSENWSSQDKVFSGDFTKLIRMKFIDCSFRYLDSIVTFTDADNYLQSWRFIGCNIRGVTVAINANWMLDLTIDNCLCEWNSRLLYKNGAKGFTGRIVDSCLEGLNQSDTSMIYLNHATSLVISGNYFEAVPNAIEFGASMAASAVLDISNNFCEAATNFLKIGNVSTTGIFCNIANNKLTDDVTKFIYYAGTFDLPRFIVSTPTGYISKIDAGNHILTNANLLVTGRDYTTGGTDFNNLRSTGTYTFEGVSVTNGPEASAYGALIVFSSISLTMQMYVKYDGSTWVRVRTGTWQNWKSIG